MTVPLTCSSQKQTQLRSQSDPRYSTQCTEQLFSIFVFLLAFAFVSVFAVAFAFVAFRYLCFVCYILYLCVYLFLYLEIVFIFFFLFQSVYVFLFIFVYQSGPRCSKQCSFSFVCISLLVFFIVTLLSLQIVCVCPSLLPQSVHKEIHCTFF